MKNQIRSVGCAAFACAAAFSAHCFAQVPTMPPGPPPSAIHLHHDEASFEADGEYYELTVGGLRKYTDTLQTNNPRVYAVMNEEVGTLELRQAVSWVAGIGGALAGVGLVYVGLASIGDDGSGKPELAIGGLGLILVSPVIGWAISPGRGRLLDAVNLHNRNNSDQRIRVSRVVIGTPYLASGANISVACELTFF